MRTRLAFLIRDLGYGGAQRQLVALACALPRDQFEVTVVHFYPGPLEAPLRAAKIRTVCAGKRGRWDLIGFFFRLARAVREAHPHILHSYLSESNVLSVLLKPFVPGVRIVWGLRDSKTDAHLWGILGKLSFRIGCLLSNRADKIIANSAAGRDYYCSKGYPEAKITVIPNGIDTARFMPDDAARIRIREEWGFTPDEFVFGHLGRLNAMKDHATLLHAAAIVFREHRRARLVCLGGGDEAYAAQMRSLAHELGISGQVRWLPPRPDVAAVCNALDALVSSSSFGEGFSNVIAEAMACGTPCVATDVGDSAFIINDARFIAPPSRPADLAAAMNRLVQMDPAERAKAVTAARNRIELNFSVPLLVRRTSDALHPLRPAPRPVPLREYLGSQA